MVKADRRSVLSERGKSLQEIAAAQAMLPCPLPLDFVDELLMGDGGGDTAIMDHAGDQGKVPHLAVPPQFMGNAMGHQSDTAAMAVIVNAHIVERLGDRMGNPAEINVHPIRHNILTVDIHNKFSTIARHNKRQKHAAHGGQSLEISVNHGGVCLRRSDSLSQPGTTAHPPRP